MYRAEAEQNKAICFYEPSMDETVRAHLEAARTAGLGKDTCLPSSLGNGKVRPKRS